MGVALLSVSSGAAAESRPDDVRLASVPPTESTLVPGDDGEAGLIVVPPGCTAPEPALAVFSGAVAVIDDPDNPTTARFRVQQTLAGDLSGYLINGEVDVRYGNEARFLDVGAQYVVGVRPDLDTGVLVSTVREPAPLFGGDAVIGFNDTDTDCPRIDEPVRTLLADGTSVDTGVLSPLAGHGGSLLLAVLQPLLWTFLGLLVLVAAKHLLFTAGRGVREVSQTPTGTSTRTPVSARGVRR